MRMQALGALLARNDITMLDIAENILLHTPTTDEHLYLSAALEGIKDVRAIPALNRLLRSGDVRTRLGAASALRQIGGPGAIDALVSALEDTDREVRYEAVVGLGEITGQYDWTPSIEVFEKNEQHYLSYWKEWAQHR